MARETETTRRRVGRAALLILLLPVILPLAAAALLLFFLHRVALHLLVWILWLPRGKSVLVVYSDSPTWREYMTDEVMPLVEQRAIVLNWSERKNWPRWSLATHAFRAFGGDREFNPLVVVFRPLCRARVFRFWPAFKDLKRGHPENVERLRQQLLAIL